MSAENYRRDLRYTALLTMIEAGYTQAERYAKLPHDDPQLAEYRDSFAQARAALEKNIDAPADDNRDRSQPLLNAYTMVLDARMNAINEVVESGFEAGAPEVVTYHRASDVLIHLLNQRLASAHSDNQPMQTAYDTEESMKSRKQAFLEQRALAKAERLTSMAGQWLSLAKEERGQMKNYVEQIAEAPAAIAQALRATMTAYTQKQHAAQSAFDQAIKAADESAALTAHQALELIRQQLDHQMEYLSEEVTIAEREKTWRAQAKDPAMAERLREWDKRRAAQLAVRRSVAEADEKALSAKHASERAQGIAEQAQEQAEEAKESMELQDQSLEELMNSLDETAEQSENSPPDVVEP